MEENAESPRKPVSKEEKPRNRTNAQTSGQSSRPDSRTNTADGQRRSAGHSREGGSGYRSARPQGSQSERSSRPQGAGTHTSSAQRGGYKPRDGAARPHTPGQQSSGYGARTSAAPAQKPVSYKKDESADDDVSPSDLSGEKTVSLPKKSDANYSMSYRGSSQRANSRNNSSPNRQSRRPGQGQRPKEASKRQSMLNTHKVAPFKYDMNEVLSQSSMDPVMASSFLASVIAKASRISTRDAKDYAKTFVDEGNLTKDEYDKISKLLDRYSKYR